MAVIIRFSRIGKKNAPFFRIVATDSRKQRDGGELENLGTYNPCTDEMIQYHAERVQDWISKGATMSDAVKKIVKKHKAAAAKKA